MSKRWQRAVYASPVLWQRFVVRNNQPGKLFMQPRLALLRRQAAHVACFSWQADGEAAGHSLPAFLAALQPSQLVQLELVCVERLSAAGLAALRQLSRLSRLTLFEVQPAGAVLAQLKLKEFPAWPACGWTMKSFQASLWSVWHAGWHS